MTRTVNVLTADAADYLEYLASEGWPVVRARPVDDGRFLEIVFRIA